MSGDATWTVMLQHIPSTRAITRWLESAREVGLHVQSPILVILTTGEGAIQFERTESAVDYVRRNGGLMSLIGTTEDDQLSLSVHLRQGILNAELQPMGEIPKFDEVRIDIGPRAIELRAAAWRTFESRALDIAADAGVFAWCATESWMEAMIPIHIHELVSNGHIPVMRPLAAAAPTGTKLATELSKQATAMALPLPSQMAAWDVYRAEGPFWTWT